MRSSMAGLLALVVAGCAGTTTGDTPPTADQFPDLACMVAYRSAVTEPLAQTEEIALEPGDEHTFAFTDVTVTFTYDVSHGEGATLWIDAGTDEGDSFLARDLYQFVAGEPPTGNFAGGHGFTGLAYVHPPGSTAEAQYSCGVPEDA